MSDGAIVGVDVGATLAKIVNWDDPGSGVAVPSADLADVRAAIAVRRPARVVATGGGATRLGDAIGGAPVERVPEFEAWARGVSLLAAEAGVALPPVHLVACVGTGTSVLRVGAGPVERVGGTAVGGGTLMGLGRLLTPARRFEDLVALAMLGDRRRVDLLVGEVYPSGDAPAEIRELTASNLAKLASDHPADLAHAIVGLVGETVALMTGALATAAGVDTVVYCGTTLVRNPPLVGVVRSITEHFGHRSHVFEQSGFGGAIGAAASAAPAGTR
jgi:type II pantothenate kinase